MYAVLPQEQTLTCDPNSLTHASGMYKGSALLRQTSLIHHSTLSSWTWKWNVSLSRVQFFATPWTVAHQAPLSMGSSRQEYWGGLPCPSPGVFLTQGSFTVWATREAQEYWSGWPIPSPGDLPIPGIKLGSPALQADSFPAELPGKPTWVDSERNFQKLFFCFVKGRQSYITAFCRNWVPKAVD